MKPFEKPILTPHAAPPDSTPVHGFYETLLKQLWRRGIRAVIAGGMACNYHHLRHNERDWDVLIPPKSALRVLDLLSKARFDGKPGQFALHAGAPLAEQWLRGGWSSHVFFGTRTRPHEPFARIDLMGRLIRGQWTDFDRNPRYLSRNDLAWMKRTRRNKDWAFVDLLGLQMLRRGDLAGLLHIQDPKLLSKIARHRPIPMELQSLRPALRFAVGDRESVSLEQAIIAERYFWQKLDELRMEAFQAAWEPYGAAIQQRTDLARLPLAEQNEALIPIAANTLNPDPLSRTAWRELIQQCREKTQDMFGQSNFESIPNPDAGMFLQLAGSPPVSRANKTEARRPMISNLVYQTKVSDELGTESAALCRLPHKVLLEQIHDDHHHFVMPQETVWPTECYLGSELP